MQVKKVKFYFYISKYNYFNFTSQKMLFLSFLNDIFIAYSYSYDIQIHSHYKNVAHFLHQNVATSHSMNVYSIAQVISHVHSYYKNIDHLLYQNIATSHSMNFHSIAQVNITLSLKLFVESMDR